VLAQRGDSCLFQEKLTEAGEKQPFFFKMLFNYESICPLKKFRMAEVQNARSMSPDKAGLVRLSVLDSSYLLP